MSNVKDLSELQMPCAEIKGEEAFESACQYMRECEIQYSEHQYVAAVDLLILAFQKGFKKEIVYTLLYQIVYEPNAEFMEMNYQRNTVLLEKRDSTALFPRYCDLNFLLFPVKNNYGRYYDKEAKRFLEKCEIDHTYLFYYKLMTFDENEIATTFVQEDLHKMLKIQYARNLWREIADQLKNGCQENSILNRIERYHQHRPFCVNYEWMMGQYYYNCGNYDMAEKWTRQGYAKARLNFNLCFLLAKICYMVKNYAESVALYSFLSYTDEIKIADVARQVNENVSRILQELKGHSHEVFEDALHRMSLYNTMVTFGPLITRHFLSPSGAIEISAEFQLGRYLKMKKQEYDTFVGVLNVDRSFNGTTHALQDHDKKDVSYYSIVTYDLMKGKDVHEAVLKKEEIPYILPIVSTQDHQKLEFTYSGKSRSCKSGKYESCFIRVDRDIQIASENTFVVGKPIRLTHHPKRKKLVLNILVDTLSFAYLKTTNFQSAPKIKRFFDQGVVFNHNYSVAEYTYPSVATIETGLYHHNSQIFHPRAYVRLGEHITPTPQHFQEQGYYCMDIVSGAEGLYNGVDDGYDRILFTPELLRASVGVERVLKHLEAFKETDNFVNLHISDLHPQYSDNPIDLVMQTSLNLDERFAYIDGFEELSVYKNFNVAEVEQYERALRDTDRALGQIFEYIEENYHDDEFIVTVYSDHGPAFLSEEKYLLKEDQSCSALMLRGANVPIGLQVDDEVTSSLDLHSILAHLAGYQIDEGQVDARLPKAFGGKGREYAISNSLYPGQTYKLCIRDLHYEFRLETTDFTTYDGRINMNRFKYQIYTRDTAHKEVYDKEIVARFLEIAYDHTKTMHDPDY